MRNRPPSSASQAAAPLLQYWQAEAVRLREAHWGPLEDRAACQAALRGPADLQRRILARAAWLAEHGDLHERLIQWSVGARWALAVLWLCACLAGIGTAAAVLGAVEVNLALALLGLLGLHALTFMIWLAGWLPGLPDATALSRLWLWLTRRLVRGPDAALAAQAFLSLLGRARAWKSAIGLISHGAWTAAFLGAVPTLVLLLSTRRYTFHWETTLLSPEAFVGATRVLGFLPGLLGFPAPDDAQIAASLGPRPLAAGVQADWSLWLIGCVVAWGLLPRLLALSACVLHLRRRLGGLAVDPGLPGWLDLRERLLPTHASLGIDRPAPASEGLADPVAPAASAGGRAAVLAYELGPGLAWPPDGLPAGVADLGRCDSREDRARIRTLLDDPPAHLLFVCDARLTPDRGAAAWLDELRRACPDLSALCLGGTPPRVRAWQDILSQHAVSSIPSLSGWLEHIGKLRHD
ncbi:DUF2868 domain-containing protein [Castellaniella denitrificans]|uniref:DUF2868 domain-containing protein n=1 Tax=Castellaniella denitrificans TaxID=56119 RepID=A0ABT4M0E5_9BURK|nr:DUF2868 domain-containing protein [Castellaniella denitrificans]MCZ4328788.1 DUF2868 domain-containing protein [Castellaniella denitrificans]